jgi:hypothetical protein
MIRKGVREVFLVKYEKIPKFCEVCGLLGDEFLECGKGYHPPKSHIFGDWMIAYVGRRGRGRTRGYVPRGGRGSGHMALDVDVGHMQTGKPMIILRKMVIRLVCLMTKTKLIARVWNLEKITLKFRRNRGLW